MGTRDEDVRRVEKTLAALLAGGIIQRQNGYANDEYKIVHRYLDDTYKIWTADDQAMLRTAKLTVRVASEQFEIGYSDVINCPFEVDANGYLKISPSGGRIAVGDVDPDSNMHIWNATAGDVAAAAGSIVTIENNDYAYLSFLTPSTKASGLMFGDESDADVGWITYDHATNAISFGTAATQAFKIDNSGNIEMTTGNGIGQQANGYIQFNAAAPLIQAIGSVDVVGQLSIASGNDLKLGVAAGTGLPPANRTLAIKDSSGTTFYLLASTTATS